MSGQQIMIRRFIHDLIFWKRPIDLCRFCDADLYNEMPHESWCLGRFFR